MKPIRELLLDWADELSQQAQELDEQAIRIRRAVRTDDTQAIANLIAEKEL